jgi:hypothetical protein
MRGIALLFLVLCVSPLPAAEAPEAKVKKIWDRGPHNAFTDLIRHGDRFYCTFREGTGHAGGAGTIRVLTSTDGDTWEAAALIAQENVDLRDPKISVIPDGRLMIVGGAAVPASRDPVRDHYSFVCFSTDGKAWTKPQRVLESWQWLWRVTWHGKTAYGVAYQWDPKAPGNAREWKAFLANSSDGVKWLKVADFDVPNPTEATLAFDGDVMYCLQRRDGQPNTALLGRSEPPYAKWSWKDLGRYYGGPNFIRLPHGAWWGAGRIYDMGKSRTALCRIDVKEGKIEPALTLPSGGDTSYPGLVWYRDELWVSYYSSHEGKTSIYLARVKLEQ